MRFVWPDSARSDMRAIDRETAVRILRVLTEYGVSGKGDLKALTGQWQGYFRLDDVLLLCLWKPEFHGVQITREKVGMSRGHW